MSRNMYYIIEFYTNIIISILHTALVLSLY